jgi:hypothetical protein
MTVRSNLLRYIDVKYDIFGDLYIDNFGCTWYKY